MQEMTMAKAQARPCGVAQDAPPVVAGVATEDWRRLYDAASLVGALAPWRWMLEDQVFGVQIPGSDRVVFASVMGADGEYVAVAVYMGIPEIRHFFAVHALPDERPIADMLFHTYQLHLSFGAKADLDPSEKPIVRDLGVFYRGAGAWPSFTSRKPGYAPYRLEADEVKVLTLVLGQLLNVAPRLLEDETLIDAEAKDGGILVRVAGGDPASAAWAEQRRDYGPYEVPALGPVAVAEATRQAFRALRPTQGAVEVDLVPMPARIGTRAERCTVPHVLLAVHSASGLVVGVDVMAVETSMPDLQRQIPERLLGMLVQHSLRPPALQVQTEWLHEALGAALAGLGTRVERVDYLEALEEARYMLEGAICR
jgi:hypothetical protein